ncbi:hypothetical protein AVEN_130819-1, partial [Araneus ventricosus]
NVLSLAKQVTTIPPRSLHTLTVMMSRSLRNESEDPDPQKERRDPIPSKRNENAKRNESAESDP